MFKRKKITKALSLFLVAIMMTTIVVPTAFASAKEAVDLEWYNFRNNPENNGVTNRPTPIDDKTASLKWASKFGEGWAAAPTPPLILDGYLYVGVNNQIIKVDKNTGKEVARSGKLVANVGFAMNPITYADGKLFVQVGNGMIQAVDFETLNPLWHTPKIGGQTLSNISYIKKDGVGYIYTGVWNGEIDDGEFYCVTTDDTDVKDGVKDFAWIFRPSGEKKSKDQPNWKFTSDPDLKDRVDKKRGFYWVGAYATSEYIAIGSDDGAPEGENSANAVFYTLDPKTGKIIDKIEGIKGDIRTSTVYDNGYLYFSTKGGQLHKISVDNKGRLGKDSYIDLGGSVTAAPLVYKNRIYTGVRGKGGQFDPDGGHHFSVVDNSKATLDQSSEVYQIPIKGYPQAAALMSTAHENEDFDKDGNADGRVYIYFTYNANPGGIYYTYDTPTHTKPADINQELYIPEKNMQNYCISTICADKEGTLYYKNDSCNLMAIESNMAFLKDVKITSDSANKITWDKPFTPQTKGYEVKVKGDDNYVNLEVVAPKDTTVKVDGNKYTNKVKIPIEKDRIKEVKIEVTASSYKNTYTIKIGKTLAINTLDELLVNTSNSKPSDGGIALSPVFAPETTNYDCDITKQSESDFYRIWPKATDGNATVVVKAGKNIKANKNGEELTPGTVIEKANGREYYSIYRSDAKKSATITIDVIAENGKDTKRYNLRLLEIIPITNLELNHKNLTLNEGEKFKLEAVVTPNDATYQDLNWSSLNEEVAKVDNQGNVAGLKAGNTTIAVTAANGSIIAKCEVTVVVKPPIIVPPQPPAPKPEPPKPSKTKATIKASSYTKTRSSKKFKLNAKSNSGGKLTFSSSNKKVATVSKSGYVTIKGIGKTTITIKTAETSKYKANYKKITVKVIPRTLSIKKLKSYKKAFKVYWTKDKYVSGYQVVIAKDKKFKKSRKIYKLSKNKYTSKYIKKLSKKKHYYVKIRSYKKVGKTYYYSKYSKIRKIKTK